MAQDESEEYEVEAILERQEFDALVREALAGRAIFHSASIANRDRIHSKYAYLVHWKGYDDVKQRSWEAEANLEDSEFLSLFKTEHNYPADHETFEKKYERSILRDLEKASENVDPEVYLMTKEEQWKEQLKINMEREERQRRERVSPPRSFNRCSNLMDIPYPHPEPLNRAFDEHMESHGLLPPGFHQWKFENRVPDETAEDIWWRTNPLKLNRSNSKRASSSSMKKLHERSLAEIASSKVSALTSSKDHHDEQQLEKEVNGCHSEKPQKHSAEDMEKRVSSAELDRSTPEGASSSSMTRIRTKVSKDDNRQMKESDSIANNERHAEHSRKRSQPAPEIEIIDLECDEIPTKAPRPEVTKIPNNSPDRSPNREQMETVGYENDPFNEADIVQPPRGHRQSSHQHLVEYNMSRLNDITHSFKEKMKDYLPLLITAYSEDDDWEFEKIFKEKVDQTPSGRLDRYAVVVFMVTHFEHKQWACDLTGYSLVEADVSKSYGAIREQTDMCSQHHRKCTWMRLFMKLIDSPMLFNEDLTFQFKENDRGNGPFRLDVFLHCMKNGAECQKRVFFEFDMPIGHWVTHVDGFLLSPMHLLCVQYGNIQHVAAYMALGGGDINAIASCLETNKVYRLRDYLDKWTRRNVRRNDEAERRHRTYYKNLYEMIRSTSKSLYSFVDGLVRQLIARKANKLWKLYMDLTFPHTIRCSPYNKMGDVNGTHQVLTCLFSPIGVGKKDHRKPLHRDEEHKLNKEVIEYRRLVDARRARLLLVLHRIEIDHVLMIRDDFEIPEFRHIASDEGFSIDSVCLVRQDMPEDEGTIVLYKWSRYTSPGAYYFLLDNEEQNELIVPGNAMIQINGRWDRAVTLVAQIFCTKYDQRF